MCDANVCAWYIYVEKFLYAVVLLRKFQNKLEQSWQVQWALIRFRNYINWQPLHYDRPKYFFFFYKWSKTLNTISLVECMKEVHIRHFAGKAILCSDFLCISLFLTSCFFHKNVNTLSWDPHFGSKYVILSVLSISVKYSISPNVTYGLLAFTWRYVSTYNTRWSFSQIERSANTGSHSYEKR